MSLSDRCLELDYCVYQGLDEAGTIELETIRNNLVKHKVKLGKEFDNFAVEEADWVALGERCFQF